MEYASYMAKGGKIQMALDHIDKWMPDDFELQKEYYQLINDKDQKGMEQFLDMYADQDRLMRYGIKYEDLGELSKAIISGSEYAKGGKTKESQMTPFQRANQIAEDRFGEFGLATLEHDDFAKVIVMSKANKLAKQYGKSSFILLDESDMETILNDNPGLLKDNYAKGGKLPNVSNLYSLMIKDRETGYGTIADGKVYTINEAIAKADKLDESNDLNNGLDTFVDILSVEELLKRPTLPKSSKKIIYDNYKEKVKLMNYLIERFGTDSTDWQKDFAKGGATSDVMTIDLDANFTGDGTIDVKKHVAKIGKKFKVKIEPSGKSWNAATVEYTITGKKKDILNFLSDDSYDEDEFGMGYDNSEIEEFFPELFKDGGYMADGGMLNDEMQTKKLAKQFEGKDLYDDEIVDEYTVKQFDSREDDDVIERWKMSKKKKFYVVPFDAQDDSFYYILVPKMKMEDGGYMAKGGKTKTNPAKFRDKVNAITKKLAGTKVPKKYKKDYGATYDKKEANTAAKRIAGAKLAEVRAKLAKKKK